MPAAPSALYLVVNPGPAGSRAGLVRLRAMLAGGQVSTLLLRPGTPDMQTPAADLAQIIALAQGFGVAVLIADDAQLALRLGADGVHLSAADALSERALADRIRAARADLGSDAIVGVDAGGSRHAAMQAGELGADYVAFACQQSPASAAVSPAPDADDDSEGAALFQDAVGDAAIDLIAWWSEIFVVPCVAFEPADLAEAQALRAAGADFIALLLPDHGDAHASAAWLAQAMAHLGSIPGSDEAGSAGMQGRKP